MQWSSDSNSISARETKTRGEEIGIRSPCVCQLSFPSFMSPGSLWDNKRIMHSSWCNVERREDREILFPETEAKIRFSVHVEVTGFVGRKRKGGWKEQKVHRIASCEYWEPKCIETAEHESSSEKKRKLCFIERRRKKRWEVTATERKWRSYTCCTRLSFSPPHTSPSYSFLPSSSFCDVHQITRESCWENRTQEMRELMPRRVDRVTEPFIRKDKVMQLFHSSNPLLISVSSLFCSISCS